MRVGILGTGKVGGALAEGFRVTGHEVRMGSRRPSGGTVSHADAAEFAEIVVLAVPGVAAADVVRNAGAERFAGKLLIDATNPLESVNGAPLTLAIAGADSAGERIQRALPAARVVKAFNTIGYLHMFRPAFPGGPPDMFIAGDDAAAKGAVTGILRDFGWGAVDVGGIENARHLEAMAMVWINAGMVAGDWDRAFKLLRKV